MGRREEVYEPALKDKKIPVLTLDHRWHLLFGKADPTEAVLHLEEKLNELVKRQGKLNTESREIHRLKKKLMQEIIPMVDALERKPDRRLEKKIEDNKRLIADCNEKLTAYKEELAGMPQEIALANYNLMLATMDACYDKLKENSEEIREDARWISQTRIELKKRIIRMKEKEQLNQELYAYMHSIFGADVIDIFDMKYQPAVLPDKGESAETAEKKE